jgi:hypothetical protein
VLKADGDTSGQPTTRLAEQPEVVRARSFQLVDDTGKVRVVLGNPRGEALSAGQPASLSLPPAEAEEASAVVAEVCRLHKQQTQKGAWFSPSPFGLVNDWS